MKRFLSKWGPRVTILVATISGVITVGALIGMLKLYRVPTRGMAPTIQSGDWIVATWPFQSEESFEAGDLVVFAPPHRPGDRYIQRIVAVPGDRITLEGGALAVNGVPLLSPDGLRPEPARGDSRIPGLVPPVFPLMIPSGQAFMLGDNFSNSLDSRYFGPIELDSITHIPRRRVLPRDRAGRLE